MIRPIVRTAIRNLRRDRSALLLTFALPIAFFTIFAAIFGAQRNGGTPKVHVVIADEDRSEASTRLISALQKESALVVNTAPEPEKGSKQPQSLPPYTALTAEQAVREGKAPVALVIPKGFGDAPISFGTQTESSTKIQLLSDSSDPIAPQVVTGLLQKAAMTSMPDVMAGIGSKYIDKVAQLTPQQKSQVENQIGSLKTLMKNREQQNQNGSAAANSDDFGGLISVSKRDVLGETKKNPIVAFYAAGIGVMFLLFSASGAGGSLLDEAESGAMDRVLSTKVNMTRLLAGKLTFLTLLGVSQLTVMFIWAAIAFKVELWTHLAGFFIMAIPTALASSAVGLLLASLSRTRAQLGAISTLLILSMSALGGSMFPRYIMPESLQKVGLITFNAWAIDGFQKVFWREEPISHLWPQVAVLLGTALVLFLLARQFARRWEVS